MAVIVTRPVDLDFPGRRRVHRYDFRPHGMYIDNSTQRVFTVSHGADQEEESIAVFQVRVFRAGLLNRITCSLYKSVALQHSVIL